MGLADPGLTEDDDARESGQVAQSKVAWNMLWPVYYEDGAIDVSKIGRFHVLSSFLEGGLFRAYVVKTSIGLSHIVANVGAYLANASRLSGKPKNI